MLVERVLLRGVVIVAVLLAGASFVVGALPGIAIYRGDVHVETLAVIEQPRWFLGILVVVLAPGALLWRDPKISTALVWTLWAMLATALVLVATFADPGAEGRTVPLWPAHVFGTLLIVLVVHLIVILPVACVIAWSVKRPDRVVLPIAIARSRRTV
jgi:hypothetical protein